MERLDMNQGIDKENKLVNGLFKNQSQFNHVEKRFLALAKEHNMSLDESKIEVKPVSSHDNKKYNHTWDCIVTDGNNSIGMSIKTNNNKTTKHPQHKSLIKHIFKQNSSKQALWLDRFSNLAEKRAMDYLLKENPLAQTLKDVRKDKYNKTIAKVDKKLGAIYQEFFVQLFEEELLGKNNKDFLRFCFSSEKYIKITWNKNNQFVIHDYLKLQELHDRVLTKVKFNPKNNNIELSFGDDLILVMRFKISFYKKHLIGSAVKGEINIKKLPDFIKEYKC